MTLGRHLLSLVVVVVFSLSACVGAKASDENRRFARVGEDPVAKDVQRITAAHARDSVFRSYLDSMDSRIQALNEVAHRVDSLARLFKDKDHPKLHLDGRSIAPLHIPETKITKATLPDEDQSTPELAVPGLDVPEIDVPEISIPGDDETRISKDGDTIFFGAGQKEMIVLGNSRPVITADGKTLLFGATGTIDPEVLSLVTGNTESPVDDGAVTPDGHKYYIKRYTPKQKAQPAGKDIWRIQGSTK